VTTSRTMIEVLPKGASVLLDTSVVLAYLTGTEAVSGLATELVDRCLATGRNPGAISAVTVTELLVRPFRAGPSAVSTVEGFVRHFADLRILDVDYATARAAARIRAAAGLSAPDALIVAAFVVGRIDVLVTNDGSWPDRLGAAISGAKLIVLEDLLAKSKSKPAPRQRVPQSMP